MLNCNSQRAEGLQEAFFSPSCSSADRIQGSSSYSNINHILVPSVLVVDTFQESPNSSQEIQSQDLHKPGSLNLQGFEDHPMFSAVNVNPHSMGGLDLLGVADPCDPMKFADMDTWNALVPSLHATSYRSLLTSSSVMDAPPSLDYGHSGSLEHVTCAATQSPMYERSMRMDTPRESDSSNSSQSFQSRLASEPNMNLNLHRNSGHGGGIPLHIRKGISFDTGLGLNLHHPRTFDYNLGPQLMNMESTFMTHSVDNQHQQIHLGTPVDQAALCGVPLNAYSIGGAGMRLQTDHGLTQISQILPSKAAKSMLTQYSTPQNFLFGSSLIAPPVCNALKLPALNFKTNPKVEQQSLNFLDSSLKRFEGYTASQQSSVTDGRPMKKEKYSQCLLSFRGARHAVDDAESAGPRDQFAKNNIITGSSAMGSVLTSEQSHTSNSADSKRARLNEQPASATNLPFKVRKEKLGERITALQQLVSPFGKTDTASVLLEAIGYIKFLQEQVQLLSTPYMKNMCVSSSAHDAKQPWTADKGKAGEAELSDLRSKGLCLMPVSCTIHVANDNGADYWTPTIGGSSR
eukprot:TRINITY_DN3322_c0_g1_i1.p1 TRINITY_DN3322_c0_g1~~TRINITY_DN3322_c0_g1_i1.p1  ORF type:complete len:574 (-),score=74.80 TRINITY_DN3322_c0_g1_i1:635-2356(-)